MELGLVVYYVGNKLQNADTKILTIFWPQKFEL